MPVLKGYTTSTIGAKTLPASDFSSSQEVPSINVEHVISVDAIWIDPNLYNLKEIGAPIIFNVRPNPKVEDFPSRLVKETVEAFPSYYKTYTGTRQTRIFPPIRDV